MKSETRRRHFEMLPGYLLDVKLNMQDAAKYIKKSSRSITRYIKYGWIYPERTKSVQGTLEYKFPKTELDRFIKQYNENYPNLA